MLGAILSAVLTASLVSGQSVVNLLLGDSSIGDSDIIVVGVGILQGSIIGVDSTATTYDVNCAVTAPVPFPFTTPACVGGDHVTITQGRSTAFVTEVFVTSSLSKNYRQDCTFSTSNTVTCSITNTVSRTLVVDGETRTTSFTEASSGVNASPLNPPLYFPVTITAGQEKLNQAQAATPTTTSATTAATTAATTTPAPTGGSRSSNTSTTTPLTIASRASSDGAILKGMWALISALFIVAYSAMWMM
ncbi:hypothetical protein B0O99DRAFT_644023 [Bisporella sp. PMI_857]|nr:hypothetical protein B0O99DRAFT_644023 [Bisporella sp. PMI_857]